MTKAPKRYQAAGGPRASRHLPQGAASNRRTLTRFADAPAHFPAGAQTPGNRACQPRLQLKLKEKGFRPARPQPPE